MSPKNDSETHPIDLDQVEVSGGGIATWARSLTPSGRQAAANARLSEQAKSNEEAWADSGFGLPKTSWANPDNANLSLPGSVGKDPWYGY
jgi:hypothetical protein